MALKQKHRTKVNDRIRIKDSVTHMYPMARVYNEGFVRARKHDSLGYPLIRIEWDKDHWAYSGEEDRWVLEAHFDVVEDKMADNRDSELLKALGDLVDSFRDGRQERSEEPDIDPRPDRELTYDEVLEKAREAAQDGEAFVVIVAKPEVFQGRQMIVPAVYIHEKREDAGLLCQSVMNDLVAQAHTRMVTMAIEIAQEKIESDGPTST